MNVLQESKLTSFLYGLLTFSWYGIWVLMALFIVIMLPFGMPDFPVTISIDDQDAGILTLSNFEYEVEITQANGKLLVKDPPAWLRIIYILFNLMMFGVVAFVIFLLRKVFSTIKAGEPFERKNGSRIKQIAIFLLLAQLVKFFEYLFAHYVLLMNTHNGSYDKMGMLTIELDTLFFILIVFVLGHIFTVAADMRQEQKLTV